MLDVRQSTASPVRLRVALLLGAVLWGGLLAVGFVAPGGWVWGMAGPIGHIENYMISLWFVTLVLAPLLACRRPSERTGVIQVYLLGVLAIVVSSFRGEDFELLSDGVPLAASVLTIGLVLWSHPERRILWQL